MLTRLPVPILSARTAGARAQTIRLTLVFILLTAAVSIFAGASVAGRAQPYLGSQTTMLALAAAGGIAFFVTFGAIGYPVVAVWAVITGIAYPFVRYGSNVTFDRLWIIGMLGTLALARRAPGHSRESRAVLLGFGLLALTFGIRAFATSAGNLGPVKLWVDAIILPLILFTAARLYARDIRRASQIALSLMIGGGVLAVMGLATPLAGFDFTQYSGGSLRFEGELDVIRLSGPYPAPEPFAVSVLVCLAATLYWIFTQRPGGRRLIGIAFAALELTAIGMTLFRAAWIGAAFVVVAALGLRPRRFGRLLVVGGVVGALLLGAASQLQQSSLYQERVDNTSNIWGRFATYEQGLQIWRHAPIFGVGVDQYHAVSEQLPPVAVHGINSVTFAHSSFVGLLAEQGLVGFLPFILVCLLAVRMVRALMTRATNPTDTALAGAASGAALAYLIMSATLTMLPYGPSNEFLAVLLGIVAGRLDVQALPAVPSTQPRPRAAAVAPP